jgi:hypothetical protein
MNIAVIIGHGPEVVALLKRVSLLSNNFILFRTNVCRATGKSAAYPVLNVFDREQVRQILLDRNVSQVVMIGSLAPTGPRVKGREATIEYIRLIAAIMQGADPNDATRQHIRSLLSDFEFPAVASVLPPLVERDSCDSRGH